LGLEFSEAVFGLLDKIAARPKIWPEIYEGIRRARLRRFPYALYFRIEDGEIVVFLVFHTARNPETLRRILRAREKPED
jgi:plasmid stabilization system protein ParE